LRAVAITDDHARQEIHADGDFAARDRMPAALADT
jgi:hypothetical protein